MKAPVFFAVVAGAAFAFSFPAHAVDTGEAIGLCDQNPNCHRKYDHTSIVMKVNGDAGGMSVVVCPLPSGTCVAQRGRPQHGARMEALIGGGEMPVSARPAHADGAGSVQASN